MELLSTIRPEAEAFPTVVVEDLLIEWPFSGRRKQHRLRADGIVAATQRAAWVRHQNGKDPPPPPQPVLTTLERRPLPRRPFLIH